MEIKLLHWLDKHQPASIADIAKGLKLTTLETLKTIAKINQIQAELIVNSNATYRLSHHLDWFDTAKIKELLLNKLILSIQNCKKNIIVKANDKIGIK